MDFYEALEKALEASCSRLSPDAKKSSDVHQWQSDEGYGSTLNEILEKTFKFHDIWDVVIAYYKTAEDDEGRNKVKEIARKLSEKYSQIRNYYDGMDDASKFGAGW